MKRLLILFAFLLPLSLEVAAQVPQALNYQAIARDAGGTILPNKTIGLKLNVLKGSATGPVEYSERQVVTTNAFGLFTLKIGRGTPITGTFTSVTWNQADQYLQVELDPNGGTNYFLMGTSELLSVPYALYAERVGIVSLAMNDLTDVNTLGVSPGQVLKWNGTTWVPANDDNTTYSAGAGLNLVGTTFEHAPHSGDAVGVTSLTVVGLQNTPVSAASPSADDVLKYNAQTGRWEPRRDSSGMVLVAGNGIAISNDTISNTIWIENNTNGNIYRDTGSVIIGGQNPHPSAILDLEANDRGFLPPRLSTQERDNINSPAAGLTIFNTTDSVMQYYNGACWLTVFQEDCDDCLFDISLSDSTGVINRTTQDTTGTTIILNQTAGTPQGISMFLLENLPQGARASLNTYNVFNSGTVRLTVEADVFAEPGVYPIAIQAVCGDRIKIQVFTVTIDSCFEVLILNNQTNYDLAAANNLPGPGTPICVVAEVFPGVTIGSNTTSTPAFDVGSLDTLSQVGIINRGAILGMGGDGGVGGSFGTFGDPGDDGGDAVHLSTRTQLDNTNGFIFGGGGGGGSVALEILNLPFIGSLSIGAGGGGGAGGGVGGTSAIPFFYAAGSDGSTGVNGRGGAGGVLNIPISIPISIATITITPNAVGGDGGEYGQAGTTGVIFVNVDVSVQFLGSIFNQNFPDPPPSLLPSAGQPGDAILRNGFPLIGTPDGNYQTTFIRGRVGN